jgi:GNAT superfamily N-acetyltransferase
MPVSMTGELTFVTVGQDDPLAQPLLAELADEYADRYDGRRDKILVWLSSYPKDEFAAPGGTLLVGLLGGRPVTGGAFRRFGVVDGLLTAELKRIWTDSAHRRRGFARALLAALEDEAAGRGYRRLYLTTGDKQPEAEALYLATGYRRLEEPLPAEDEVYPVAFTKRLS